MRPFRVLFAEAEVIVMTRKMWHGLNSADPVCGPIFRTILANGGAGGAACILLLVAVLGTACVPLGPVSSPESRARNLERFRAGEVSLTCGPDCNRQRLMQYNRLVRLHDSGQWEELAYLVIQIDFEQDYTYYLLGRAAEELGFFQAAERYYHHGWELFHDQWSMHHCRDGVAGEYCGGIDLGRALPSRLALVRTAGQSQQARDTQEGQDRIERPISQAITEKTDSTSPGQGAAETGRDDEAAAVPAPGVAESTRASSELPEEGNAQADSLGERLVPGGERDAGVSLVEPGRADPTGQKTGGASSSTEDLPEETGNMPTEDTTSEFPGADKQAGDPARDLAPGGSTSTATGDANTPQKQEVVLPPALGYGMIKESTSLVAAPSVMADPEGVVPRGATVELLEERPKFYKVRWNGREGFVYSNFVRKLSDD